LKLHIIKEESREREKTQDKGREVIDSHVPQRTAIDSYDTSRTFRRTHDSLFRVTSPASAAITHWVAIQAEAS
jgi:hypothetical protein